MRLSHIAIRAGGLGYLVKGIQAPLSSAMTRVQCSGESNARASGKDAQRPVLENHQESIKRDPYALTLTLWRGQTPTPQPLHLHPKLVHRRTDLEIPLATLGLARISPPISPRFFERFGRASVTRTRHSSLLSSPSQLWTMPIILESLITPRMLSSFTAVP